MGYEVDFLAVGDSTKSGDAIALRFGNLYGGRDEQTVIVIDGGTKQSGESLCTHIQNYYNTDWVNAVISTHPDGDHACGLCEVVSRIRVDNVIMHRPWLHAPNILDLFKNKTLTPNGLERKIEKSLQHAKDLEEIAETKKIPIYEPFMGLRGFGDTMLVLGPNREYYRSLLPNFRGTPQPLTINDLFKAATNKAQDIIEWFEETIDPSTETLDHTHKNTSAENLSSTIILFNFEGKKVLFTSDAGVESIQQAIQYANNEGITLSDLSLLQMPHHGSKHNVDTAILNSVKAETALISACVNGDPKHPSRKVVNALHRRGFIPITTQGKTVSHFHNSPAREGWAAAPIINFFSEVEEG